jgi:ribulose bisphosphate carboxylase small subunit
MASLKITRADGTVTTHEVTPSVEYAFEQQFRKGFHKAFREDERQEHIYWLAWECLRRADAPDVKPFGLPFLETLKEVEVVADDSPNG